MESKAAVAALSALAQETRFGIYRMLVEKGPVGAAAGSIGDALKLAPATLSFHLRELCHAGLISARQQSRFIYYSADSTAMSTLLNYLAENCCASGARTLLGDAAWPSPPMPSDPPVKSLKRKIIA